MPSAAREESLCCVGPIPGIGSGSAPAAWIGRQAQHALLLELQTHPKPGLVSHLDSGSHPDMDATIFRASIDAIGPFLVTLVALGSRLAGMEALRSVGIEAEAAMLRATGGVNTHRGAIFGLGLLCAAAGARQAGRARGPLGGIVASLWGRAIGDMPVLPESHGGRACLRHGVGGARQEAISGFGSIYRIGLPALARGLDLGGGDREAARLHCLFALMAQVDDTALLHRGGRQGLMFAREMAQAFLGAGSVGSAGWRHRALSMHRQFVARNLSAGGCADLLAMSLFAATLSADGTGRRAA